MDVAEEIRADVSILYSGLAVSDLTKYRFVLHNTGSAPIEEADIVRPLVWRGPGEVCAMRKRTDDSAVELRTRVHGNEVEFTWPLFNPGCRALVEIFCKGSPEEQCGALSGQIRNISSVSKLTRRALRDETRTRVRVWNKAGLLL